MRVVLFTFYFLKLRLSVLFGTYQTVNPLDLKWRWRQWNRNHLAQRKRLSKSEDKELNKVEPAIIQNSSDKKQSEPELKDLVSEAAVQAFENIEKMHRNDITRRKKNRNLESL